ncbi:hypothetical protein HNR39_004149 [Glaciimonas immobilis]|uniref:Uncharacterized protein n=1 Tax=Glaciimonas immobilis TaxID=728004 RepID=A0A840RWM7_9BURK|nr:hypothetical protein [Glaciimonas immobilis]
MTYKNLIVLNATELDAVGGGSTYAAYLASTAKEALGEAGFYSPEVSTTLDTVVTTVPLP